VKTAVLNASPVIILARAGFLELVPKLVSSPVIPRAVATEIKAGRAEDPAFKFVGAHDCRPESRFVSACDLALGSRRE
jgi:hypothetical protein